MAATHVFEGLVDLKLEVVSETSTVRFRLTFRSKSKTDIVQFELSSGHALAFLSGLQTIQRKRRWRVPSYGRQKKPPVLTVCSDDD